MANRRQGSHRQAVLVTKGEPSFWMALKSRKMSVKKREEEKKGKGQVHLEKYIVGRFKKCTGG
jgi:hypothetical protein